MKKRTVKVVKTREQLTLYERPKTGRLVPCPGTAHQIIGADHCMTCAPRWGEVEERAPADLEVVKKGGLAVYVGDVADEKVDDLIKAGAKLVEVEERRRGGTAWFNVLVFAVAAVLGGCSRDVAVGAGGSGGATSSASGATASSTAASTTATTVATSSASTTVASSSTGITTTPLCPSACTEYGGACTAGFAACYCYPDVPAGCNGPNTGADGTKYWCCD